MSRILRLAAGIFGTIFIAFGFNALFNPSSALTFFELQYPTLPGSHKQLADALLAVYGVRDIFMGLVIYVVALWSTRKSLGLVILAAFAVALADGAVCHFVVGNGAMNHWGYAPMLGLLSTLLLYSSKSY